MNCKSCGEQIEEGFQSCWKCGTEVEDVSNGNTTTKSSEEQKEIPIENITQSYKGKEEEKIAFEELAKVADIDVKRSVSFMKVCLVFFNVFGLNYLYSSIKWFVKPPLETGEFLSTYYGAIEYLVEAISSFFMAQIVRWIYNLRNDMNDVLDKMK